MKRYKLEKVWKVSRVMGCLLSPLMSCLYRYMCLYFGPITFMPVCWYCDFSWIHVYVIVWNELFHFGWSAAAAVAVLWIRWRLVVDLSCYTMDQLSWQSVNASCGGFELFCYWSNRASVIRGPGDVAANGKRVMTLRPVYCGSTYRIAVREYFLREI